MTIVVEVRNYKILLIRQSDCVLVYKQDDYAVSVAKMHMAHSLISAREFELDIGQATCTWKPQQHLLLLLLQHTSRATAHTIGPVPMTTFQFQIVFSLCSTSVWDRISATSLIQQVYNVGGNGQYYELKKGSFFFAKNNNFCIDIHYETHLELKYLKVSFQHWFVCVMAERCNNCIAGHHTLPSSQWTLEGNGNYSVEDTLY